MPKLFIFAIGGTGERVLRSLTMVLASGAPTFKNYDVYPIIIDYDQANADKVRTMSLLQIYSDIHDAIYQNNPRAGQFFSPKLYNMAGLENYVFPFKPAIPNEKFRDHIGYKMLAGDTLNTANLLSSLFDDSNNPDTELNLDMTVGFKGNPNIGSVVFHTINSTKEFATFRTLFQPAAGDKVVIIGSLFGGTGASGIPEIVKAISALNNNAKIATVLVLPYFAPDEKKNGAIQASRFNSKTKAALGFYEDSGIMNSIDKVYYVGDPYPTVVKYSEGGATQSNNANFVELIAAMMIEHYVADRGDKNKEFKYSPNANIVVSHDGSGGKRLFIRDLDQNTVNVVMSHLVELAIGLKVFHDEISSKKENAQSFFKILDLEHAVGKEDTADSNNNLRTLCKELEKFYVKYKEWLKELDFEGNDEGAVANSHRIAIADMEKAYSDIIPKEAELAGNEEKSGGFMSLFSSKGSGKKLNSDFLLTRMNYHMRDVGEDKGHYDTKKNDLRDGHDPAWVFNDILYLASKDGYERLTKEN